jgi:MOSC domain-containing protein YiiM
MTGKPSPFAKDKAMHEISGSIVSVQVGSVAPLGPRGVPSGFVKQPVERPAMAGPLGLAGDSQADRSVHGGPDKALYCYPVEHYASWCTVLPRHAKLFAPGGLGENVTTRSLDEDNVAIGDLFRIGQAKVQVTQPRQPCFKLALRFDDPQMVRAMVRSGFTGWYLRVLEPGLIGAGDSITLIDRPNPTWSVARFNRLIYEAGTTVQELSELAELRGLADGWRQSFHAALGKRAPSPDGSDLDENPFGGSPPAGSIPARSPVA